MSVDKINGVEKFVSENSNVLYEIEDRKEVVELNSL